MTGTGPGTFEFWWAEHGTIPGFVRDAHSLFFETLGEMGVVGFALIAALVFGVVAVGAWRVVTAPVASRPWLAAATAAAAAFAGAAAIDWAWELAVLPVVFLLLAAAVLAPGLDAPAVPSSYRPAPRPRVALSALALAGLVAVAVPFASSSWLRASQDDVSGGQLGSALDNARQAADIEPYAATPSLQQALVLELEGDLGAAAAAAREATSAEPTNWRTWLVLSRIEAFRGSTGASVRAFREARRLNPRSPLFAQ